MMVIGVSETLYMILINIRLTVSIYWKTKTDTFVGNVSCDGLKKQLIRAGFKIKKTREIPSLTQGNTIL